MKRFLNRLKLWATRMDGIDDPQGEYLLSLERRIQALEEAQRALRQPP